MKKAAGFAIASAIFLLVILSLLGAFMLTLSNTEHLTSARDVQGSRAYRAARAGLEWAAAKLSADSSACPAASTTLDDGDGSPPADLEDFTVVVTCTMNSYSEGSGSPNVFWIESTATAGGAVGGIGYVERSLDAFIEF